MIKKREGSVTVFLALSMFSFLTLCLVLIEGMRIYYIRTKAMQSIELTEFSVLSEFQKELFENYGVFFLDLDYEQGDEKIEILEQRAGEYLRKNIGEVQTTGIETSNFRRATDADGSAYLLQAIELTKVKHGYKLLEDIFGGIENITPDEVDLEEILHRRKGQASGIVDSLKTAAENTLLKISLPDISFPSVKLLRETILGNETNLSNHEIILAQRLQKRKLCQGEGKEVPLGIIDMQWFQLYLFENFCFFGDKNEAKTKEVLRYQLEYIIAGKDSDLKNLENIMWRIFLLRAGGDYLCYRQSSEHQAEAELKAVSAVGFTGNAALISLIKELFLISQAIEDGIQETKTIFAGGKVPFYKNGVSQGIALGYEQYLYMFLNMTAREHKIYRSMDVIELEVRKSSGYEHFKMDHCVDCFDLEWSYRFDGLLWSGLYENTIKRTINYEM